MAAALPRRPDAFNPGVEPIGGSAIATCDVVHYPLTFMSQPKHDLPGVVTCMDLQHIERPQAFSRVDRLLRMTRWHASLRRADRVIAPSQYTRESLVERLGLSADQIDVVHLACHERFFESPPPRPAGLPDEYVFYPASPLPAKNHARLLKAFAAVAGRFPDVSLVLSGPDMHDWSAVHERVALESLEGRVVFAGHLRLDQLRAHYAYARALIFPSLFEGFGLPVLEAMATGCAIATSGVTSIPEVAGEVGITFDPRDEGAIADAIERSLGLTGDARAATVAGGRARAETFRLPRMIDETRAVYQRAVAAS